MSSTRVMGTGCSMGQAVGAAAALAVRLGVPPRGVNGHVKDLQQALLRDDAYLPWTPQEFSSLTRNARLTASQGDPEPLRDGINRPVSEDLHCWTCKAEDQVAYEFGQPTPVKEATLILDSALDQRIGMSYHEGRRPLTAPPPVMPKSFRLEGLHAGQWAPLARVAENHQRLVRLPIRGAFEGVRFVVEGTWGADETRLYGFYLD